MCFVLCLPGTRKKEKRRILVTSNLMEANDRSNKRTMAKCKILCATWKIENVDVQLFKRHTHSILDSWIIYFSCIAIFQFFSITVEKSEERFIEITYTFFYLLI